MVYKQRTAMVHFFYTERIKGAPRNAKNLNFTVRIKSNMTMVSVRNFRSYGADIYGWTGSKETPCTKKNMCLAPLSTIFISPLQKKSGGLGTPEKQTFCAPD